MINKIIKQYKIWDMENGKWLLDEDVSIEVDNKTFNYSGKKPIKYSNTYELYELDDIVSTANGRELYKNVCYKGDPKAILQYRWKVFLIPTGNIIK